MGQNNGKLPARCGNFLQRNEPKTQVSILTGHTRGVDSVAISPDGKYIVSGSVDRTIRVFKDLSPENRLIGVLTKNLRPTYIPRFAQENPSACLIRFATRSTLSTIMILTKQWPRSTEETAFVIQDYISKRLLRIMAMPDNISGPILHNLVSKIDAHNSNPANLRIDCKKIRSVMSMPKKWILLGLAMIASVAIVAGIVLAKAKNRRK
jgi:WD40 repeat protein